MTELEAVRGGTLYAAGLLGFQDLGALKKGYLADIAVTDQDPLKDISCLADAGHITFVAADGQIVKNRL